MTIKNLKNTKLIKGEIITGSHLYGLNNKNSDIDIKGFYKLPNENILGFNYIDFIKDERGDTNYYELGKFIGMLNTGNPNVLEMLYIPDEFIKIDSPLYQFLRQKRDLFLTKECGRTFGGYAVSQIKKARGLNKNIVQKVNKTKKSLIEFCHTIEGSKSKPLSNLTHINFGTCGIVKCQNGRNVYALYIDNENKYNLKGITKEHLYESKDIISDRQSNSIRLSSIPKELDGSQRPINFYFNEDGYRTYCKKYTEYWKWVKNRNEARYNSTKKHGKGYDAKNMMHTFRLLRCGIEIAKEGYFNVNRTNIDKSFLLGIREGKYEYDDLIKIANEEIQMMNGLYDNSFLPEKMNDNELNDFLIDLRLNF